MLDIDLHNMFRKRVSSSALSFNSWAYHLCLNFLLFCRLCPEELALGEIGEGPHVCYVSGDDSFNDETASAGEQLARVLQSRFNCGEEDTGPVGSISIEMRSRRW